MKTWATKHKLDIIGLTETHVKGQSTERNQDYHFFFSSTEKEWTRGTGIWQGTKVEPAGVGCMIRAEFIPNITKLEQISSRIMKIVINTTPTTHIIIVYTPQAKVGFKQLKENKSTARIRNSKMPSGQTPHNHGRF